MGFGIVWVLVIAQVRVRAPGTGELARCLALEISLGLVGL